MVKTWKKAMQRRGVRTQEALLLRVEGELDAVYDLIHHVFAEEETSLKVLQGFLKRATYRSKHERYERYLRLWVLRIAVEAIQKAYPRFLSEQHSEESVSFDYLSLEEKLVLFLQDRAGLSADEIAGVVQVPVGRVGRSLAYAREKVAESLGLEWSDADHLALRERMALNCRLEQGSRKAPWTYLEAMRKTREYVVSLPQHRFSTIEASIRQQQLLPLLGRPEGVRWQDLSWQYKLGLEASLLGVVGLLAVVVLPWAFSQVNADALLAGRITDAFRRDSQAVVAAVPEEITADRLLASTEESGPEVVVEADEFANMEFPDGDSYEAGTAPLAPSRQAAAVYRLIVQSASPKELIPQVRLMLAQKNVREREGSGRNMPGGVFFDGVTNVGTYPLIVQEMQKLGQTKTYSHPGGSKNPNERARVIVWVQQI